MQVRKKRPVVKDSEGFVGTQEPLCLLCKSILDWEVVQAPWRRGRGFTSGALASEYEKRVSILLCDVI
jgi:hypothetical protein